MGVVSAIIVGIFGRLSQVTKKGRDGSMPHALAFRYHLPKLSGFPYIEIWILDHPKFVSKWIENRCDDDTITDLLWLRVDLNALVLQY